MFRRNPKSIEFRVHLLVAVVGGLSVLLTTLGAVTAEYLIFKEKLLTQRTEEAHVIAANAASALNFQDPEFARESLAILGHHPNIEAACAYEPDGAVFAHFPSSAPASVCPPAEVEGHRFEESTLKVFQSLVYEGRDVGTLYLGSSLAAFRKDFRRFLAASSIGAVLTLALAWTLSQRFQRTITRPIAALQESAELVRLKGDYGVRAQVLEDDDLGRLTRVFNQMLEQIQSAHAALLGSERRFRTLFEGSPISLWEVDLSRIKARVERLRREGTSDLGSYFAQRPQELSEAMSDLRILDVNQATLDLFEAASTEELIANRHKLFDAEAFLSFARRIHALESPDLSFDVDVKARSLEGRELQVSVHQSVAPGHDETWARTILSVVDQTERRELEEQLRQAQKMEAFGQLAGGIAHEFNNILTGLVGFSELALRQLDEDSDAAAQIRRARDLADRAAELTSRLLASSRQQILRATVVDLNEIVEEALIMLRRLLGEHIQIDFQPGEELGSVKVDRGQVEQVLLNLALNARDAMPGGGQLNISTRNADLDESYAGMHQGVRPGRYVMLAVSDTGHGMDEATQTRIFEPFFTTKEVGEGTGLGLSTVHGIVHKHGGGIVVHSEPRQGSTFKVFFPRTGGKKTALAPVARTRLPGGKETILVLEDQAQVRSVVRTILERQGFRVLEADRPSRAGEILAREGEEIDLLLTDVVMPEESGDAFYQRIVGRYPSLRVLFVSGYADEEKRARFRVTPGAAFLAKPFNSNQLLESVREVLDRPGARRPVLVKGAGRRETGR